jgi:hypothetical protein
MTSAFVCTVVQLWESFGGEVRSEAFESSPDGFLEAGRGRGADGSLVKSREDVTGDGIEVDLELVGVHVGQHVSGAS